ncbi:MAG TPA: alpha/beta fold hydrolase [Acidobacteriaceae bacterium]
MTWKPLLSAALLLSLTAPAFAQSPRTPEQVAAELQARADARTTVKAPGVTESAVSFATNDGLTLPGTLTLPPVPPPDPKHPEKPVPRPPIAVLVQGSGVQDRDATIGGNKFFQQLAWGLAARGVATLRYDRRPKVDIANFYRHADLDHEVVLDAASALAFVQTLPGVDPARVFLVGHSLGAQLAPDTVALRLSQRPGSVAGMVLLSGVARPIDQAIDEQVRTFGKNQGASPEQIASIAKMWSDVWAQARDPKVPDDQRIGVGASLPASYWRDWLRRDPVATMHTLSVPTLVTRGTKDVNSTHADFDLLKAAAAAWGSDAREFAGLNHLYMPIEGESNGADVLKPGKVSAEFLDYLAGWLNRTGAPNPAPGGSAL